jgi:ankyrin repeat protein/DNA-directed RNA polymerase subunit RPC12/RpoP
MLIKKNTMDSTNSKLKTQLIKAVEQNKVRKVKKLLNKGADPDTLMNKKGLTALMHAAWCGNEKLVQLLLEYKPDLNRSTPKENLSALLYACVSGNFEIIKMLAEAGADIQASDTYKKNALMYAVEHKDIEILKYLIDRGIDINTLGNENENILYYASDVIHIKTNGEEIDYEFIKQLIDLGADVNNQDRQGESFLTTAVRSENLDFVKFVLENGGDVNKHGNKAFSVAMYNDSRDIAEFLWEHINKPKPLIMRYKFETQCEQCNRMFSLAEPIKQIECPHCSSLVMFEEDEWDTLFGDSIFFDSGYSSARTHFMNPGQHVEEKQLKRMELLCLSCNEALDISVLDQTNNETITCSSCNHEHVLFEPEEWIKTYDVYGLKPIKMIKDTDKTKESIQVETDCLSCSAPMKLNSESLRNYTCEHCGAKQYLTDPIWMKLHPVIMNQYWYIIFN